jgi:hypothetical protein
MRITFHLGEDEVSRFEIASHVSREKPGVRSPGGGARSEGMREHGPKSRLPGRGVAREDASGAQTPAGTAGRAVKAKKPEGRGPPEGEGQGNQGGGGSEEGRLPLLESAASATPELPPRLGSPPPKRRHHLRQGCYLTADLPFSRPIFPRASSTGFKTPDGGGAAEVKTRWIKKGGRPRSIHLRPPPQPVFRRSQPGAVPRPPGGPRPLPR